MPSPVSVDKAMEAARAYGLFHLPPHLLPLFLATSSGLVSASILHPSTKGLALNAGKAGIVTAFDVRDGGVGPAGFCPGVVESLLPDVQALCVLSRHGDPRPYEWAIGQAIGTGGLALLVETTDARLQPWLDLAPKIARPANWFLWSSATQGVG